MISIPAFQRGWDALLDLFYPRQCRLCGDWKTCQSYPFLCESCFLSPREIVPPMCERCGLPMSGAFTENVRCPNCSGIKIHFDSACSALTFKGVTREVIHRFKYSREEYWMEVILHWFLAGAERRLDPTAWDMIVPVPLFPRRERERGFNQAGILAGGLSEKWGVPCRSTLLKRVRETDVQANLDREERQQNVKGAFDLGKGENVQDQRVLLVDDVMTTGSTVNECAQILKKKGAVSVLVFTLARGY